MNTCDLSIVIPVYKAPVEALCNVLDSIHNQTAACSFEVLVVLDGRESNAALLEAGIEQQYANVKLIIQDHAGVAAARNTGIEQAAGTWVMFMDADDRLPAGAFAAYAEEMGFKETDMIFANHDRVYGARVETIDVFPRRTVYTRNSRTDTLGIVLSSGTDLGTVWAKLFRTDFLNSRNLRFNTALVNGEDQEFMVRCVMSMRQVVCIPACGYVYQYNATSAVRKYNPHYIQECIATLHAVRRDLHTLGSVEQLDTIFHVYCLDRLLIIVVNNLFNPNSPLSNHAKRHQLSQLVASDLFGPSLQGKYIQHFPKQKQLVLWSAKYRLFLLLSLAMWVRHRQLMDA